MAPRINVPSRTYDDPTLLTEVSLEYAQLDSEEPGCGDEIKGT